jgi:cell division initiation protein
MKITPIEIRQHTFQRTLRGYDTEDVTAFLTSLSNEWERVLNENKMLKMQLEIAEKELNKLREVELTMFRMLKNAEDTSAQMTEQAKVAAEAYINEARQKSEELVNEARQKSEEYINESRKRGNMLLMDAENQAKYVRDEIMGEFKNHERDFKAIEKYRDNLLVQLKTLANNTTDSIERFEKKFAQITFKEKIGDLKDQVGTSLKVNEEAQKARLEAEKAAETVEEEAQNAVEGTENVVAEVAAETTEQVEETVADAQEVAESVVETANEAVENITDEVAEIAQSETTEEKSTEKGSFFDNI